MPDDYTVNFRNVQDEARPERDGVVRYRRYDFYIGKHGPFTERVPLDGFTDAEITRRVEALRAHLRTLPH